MSEHVRPLRELEKQARWFHCRLLARAALWSPFSIEGSASPKELAYFMHTAQRRQAQNIAEVGFNAGCSSYAWLASKPDTRVVSFDLGEHRYVRSAKKYIDKQFPGRHDLVFGDSTVTIPDYHERNPEVKFDIAFIDGGHTYETALQDLENMQHLCNPNGAVIIDDLTPWLEWGVGPTTAWKELIGRGVIRQEELYQNGQRVECVEPSGKRAWALGSYAVARSEQ